MHKLLVWKIIFFVAVIRNTIKPLQSSTLPETNTVVDAERCCCSEVESIAKSYFGDTMALFL
jgi:hypothetical protein